MFDIFKQFRNIFFIFSENKTCFNFCIKSLTPKLHVLIYILPSIRRLHLLNVDIHVLALKEMHVAMPNKVLGVRGIHMAIESCVSLTKCAAAHACT